MSRNVRALWTLLCCLGAGCVTCPEDRMLITLYEPEVEGLTVTVNGVTVQDPDGPFIWNWGDGTTDKSYFPNKHTYQKPGFYHITVDVSHKGRSGTEDLYLEL